jgi:hypothetical protein
MKYLKIVFATVTVLLFFTSNIEASLSVNPGLIIDTLYAGGNNTSQLYITNLGPVSPLNYSLSADVSWISFSSTSGSINVGDTVEIEISYDISYLQNGINNANIYVGDPHHGPITIPVGIYFQNTTDVTEEFLSGNLDSFSLNQNYPNPFNPATKIFYSIPETQNVMIKLFNILGNEIMTLVNGERPKGRYIIDLDMSGYPSGVYFYMIRTPFYTETKKMILNK